MFECETSIRGGLILALWAVALCAGRAALCPQVSPCVVVLALSVDPAEWQARWVSGPPRLVLNVGVTGFFKVGGGVGSVGVWIW